MHTRRRLLAVGSWLVMLSGATALVLAAPQSRPLIIPATPGLTWQPLGPNEAGSITAITGDRFRAGVFYAAASGAGLWKSTDFGATWTIGFPAPPSGIVTAIAVASGSRLLVAVRTTSGSQLYGSEDDGLTWVTVGAPVEAAITDIQIDPANGQHVFVTAETAGRTRSLYRSIDGGRTLVRALDTRAGWSGSAVAFHPGRAGHVVAIGQRNGDNGDLDGDGPVLFSNDGGATWQAVAGVTAPASGSVSVDIAAGDGGGWYLLVSTTARAALYRSDDGRSWVAIEGTLPALAAIAQPRLATSAHELVIAADRLYVSSTGGRSFTEVDAPLTAGVKLLWSHPTMHGVWLAAGTDGASVTVNAAATWSAADNLPATVVDRLVVDTAFPSRTCATTPAGTSCAPTAGERAARWQPLPPQLGSRPVPDPLDDNLVWGGAGIRYDRRTGQATHLAPGPALASGDSSVPLAFSANGRTLFAGTDRLWSTGTNVVAWEAVSPTLGGPEARIATVAVSPIDARTIWIGFDDGRVFATRTGGAAWTEAARPADAAGGDVRRIEPSRFDARSAYVVLGQPDREGAPEPGRLLRTRDEGATWIDIGAQIDGATGAFAVREDPFRRGMLFAGTDRSVFVSFDDGDRWQSLALDLPPTPVLDLAIRDANLIAATGGRGVWMLEDFSPLRQMTADVLAAEMFLFRPAAAWRVRASADGFEPDGRAMLTYSLGATAAEVTIEVIDTTTGDLIRRFSSSTDPASTGRTSAVPVPVDAGLHRITWDLRYPPPAAGGPDVPGGTRVVPGTYQVRLTVDGRVVRQTVTIRLDPRLRTTILDLTAQRDLSRALDRARATVQTASESAATRQDLRALADELNRLAAVLQQTDARPSAQVEAAIEDAIARVAIVAASDTR